MGMVEVGDVLDDYKLSSESFLTNNRLIDQIWQKAEKLHQDRISAETERMNLWKADITERLDVERKTSSKPNYMKLRQILISTLSKADIHVDSPKLVQKLMQHDIFLPTNAKLTRIWQEAKALERIQMKDKIDKARRIDKWTDEAMSGLRHIAFKTKEVSQRKLRIDIMLVRTLHEAGLNIPPSAIGLITNKYDAHAWSYTRLLKVWEEAEVIVNTHKPEEIEFGEEYENWMKKMPKDVDWSKLSEFEEEDLTTSAQEFACSGGSCEFVDVTN
jgi:hypothetical protein